MANARLAAVPLILHRAHGAVVAPVPRVGVFGERIIVELGQQRARRAVLGHRPRDLPRLHPPRPDERARARRRARVGRVGRVPHHALGHRLRLHQLPRRELLGHAPRVPLVVGVVRELRDAEHRVRVLLVQPVDEGEVPPKDVEPEGLLRAVGVLARVIALERREEGVELVRREARVIGRLERAVRGREPHRRAAAAAAPPLRARIARARRDRRRHRQRGRRGRDAIPARRAAAPRARGRAPRLEELSLLGRHRRTRIFGCTPGPGPPTLKNEARAEARCLCCSSSCGSLRGIEVVKQRKAKTHKTSGTTKSSSATLSEECGVCRNATARAFGAYAGARQRVTRGEQAPRRSPRSTRRAPNTRPRRGARRSARS